VNYCTRSEMNQDAKLIDVKVEAIPSVRSDSITTIIKIALEILVILDRVTYIVQPEQEPNRTINARSRPNSPI